MKKLILLGAMFFALNSQAQAPQGVNYQAVIRNTNGTTVNNSAVGIRMNILQGSASGTVVYSETFTETTSNIGLVNFVVGEGNVVSGDFSTINWGAGPYFLEVAADASGGTTYAVLGAQQMMSVPYALYAENSGTPGPQGAPGPQGPQGIQGATGLTGTAGVGITSTVNNGNGTYTFNYSDGSSFTTANLTGPTGAQGLQGIQGATGATGTAGVGITSTVNNGNGTYTFNYSDGSSFTTANLTGPAGATGSQGSQGLQGIPGATGATGAAGVGITSTVNNGNGTYTFNYSDGSSFTTANLTGPAGAQGLQGLPGVGIAQTISQVGNIVTLSDGGGSINVNDADSNPTNELQTLSVSNDSLFISNGNGISVSTLQSGSIATHGYINLISDSSIVFHHNALVEVTMKGGNGGNGGNTCNNTVLGMNGGYGVGVRVLINVSAGDTLNLQLGVNGTNGCNCCVVNNSCYWSGGNGTTGSDAILSINDPNFTNPVIRAHGGTGGQGGYLVWTGSCTAPSVNPGSNGVVSYGPAYYTSGCFLFETNLGGGGGTTVRW